MHMDGGGAAFDASLFSDETAEPTADSSDSAESGTGQDSKQTIRQKLESEWSQNIKQGQQQQTAFERRQQRRKEFFQQVSSLILPALRFLYFFSKQSK